MAKSTVPWSSFGGLPELNVHGETGFLCDLGDVKAMAAATREILANDALYDTMRANARRRAVEDFEVSRIVPRYEAY